VQHQRPLDSVTPGGQIKPTQGVPAAAATSAAAVPADRLLFEIRENGAVGSAWEGPVDESAKGGVPVRRTTQHQSSRDLMGPTVSPRIARAPSLRMDTPGVVGGPVPDAHASTQTVRSARPLIVPVVAQMPPAHRTIGTASYRMAVRQTPGGTRAPITSRSTIVLALLAEVVTMAAVSIRNLDDTVRERLRMRAAAHGRSMEAEMRAILIDAVREPHDDEDLLEALATRFGELGGVDLDLPPRSEAPRAVDFTR